MVLYNSNSVLYNINFVEVFLKRNTVEGHGNDINHIHIILPIKHFQEASAHYQATQLICTNGKNFRGPNSYYCQTKYVFGGAIKLFTSFILSVTCHLLSCAIIYRLEKAAHCRLNGLNTVHIILKCLGWTSLHYENTSMARIVLQVTYSHSITR